MCFFCVCVFTLLTLIFHVFIFFTFSGLYRSPSASISRDGDGKLWANCSGILRPRQTHKVRTLGSRRRWGKRESVPPPVDEKEARNGPPQHDRFFDGVPHGHVPRESPRKRPPTKDAGGVKLLHGLLHWCLK